MTYFTWLAGFDPRDSRANLTEHAGYRSARAAYIDALFSPTPRQIAHSSRQNPGELVIIDGAYVLDTVEVAA